MNKTLLLFILIFASVEFACVSSTKNEMERLSCTNSTDVALVNEENYLNKQDIKELSQNEKRAYYYDQGMLNYAKFVKTKDDESFVESEKYFKICWEEYGQKASLNNLAILYYFHGDCDLARETFELYLSQLEEAEKKEAIVVELQENINGCN